MGQGPEQKDRADTATMAEKVNLIQTPDSPQTGVTGDSSTPDQPRDSTTPHQNGAKGSNASASKPKGSKAYVEMIITPYGPQLESVDYDQLLQSCNSVLQEANKLVNYM